MTTGIDHLNAWEALLEADAGLNPYHAVVPASPADRYALYYFYLETPDGLQAPDTSNLTGDALAIDSWVYVHSIGLTPESALAESDRVRAAVLNRTPIVAGRSCFPIRRDRGGQPPTKDEDVPGSPVFDQVDVYSWRSVPG